MLLRITLSLLLIGLASFARGQNATLVEHLDQTASAFGYSLVYSPAAIPDTTFTFSVNDSASVRSSFSRLTDPFGLTFNLLANQIIITATRIEQLTFSGFVQDINSGERLIGAAVYIQNSTRGTYTNGYGYFSLPKVKANDTVIIKYLGYPARQIVAGSATSERITIRLRPNIELELVEIFPVDEELTQLPKSGRSVPLALLRKTEYLRGRPDLNAWLNLQPGINSGASGFRGFSIRGADPDHNLVLLDDATLYLPSHAGGYMSIIPGEAINSVQLSKNAGTARYGDRVGGVLDIRLRDGSTEKRRTNLNFGITDLSFNTEGPIGKGSYFLSGRRGLTDFWLSALRPTIQPQESNIPNIDYSLYDVAGKINYPLGPRSRIHASVFLGRDQYEEVDQATFFSNNNRNEFIDSSTRSWSNLVSSLRYNLTIGSRWFANTTLTASQFNYDASDFFLLTENIDNASPSFNYSQYFYGTRLRDISLRQDAEYAWKKGLSLKIGADAIQHRFEVGTLGNEDTNDVDAPEVIDPTQLSLPKLITYDISSYGYVDWQVNQKLDVNLGLRVSGQLGGAESFLAALPRVAFEYAYSRTLSFHGDAGLSRQYIHQVTTLNPGLPRDLWVPSVNGLTPQKNRYASLGFNLESIKKQAFGVELFANQLEGLSRFANEVVGVRLNDWGQTIRRGKGYSYGAELEYTGNISSLQYDVTYAYMQARRTFQDAFGEYQDEERFTLDRRHFLTASVRLPINQEWGVGTTWRIGSGLPGRIPTVNPIGPDPPPTTQPLTNPWTYGTDIRELPTYHSLDIGFRFTKSVKTNVYNLSFGVQNVYLRRNALFINLREIDNPQAGESEYGYTLVNSLPFLPFLRYGITF